MSASPMEPMTQPGVRSTERPGFVSFEDSFGEKRDANADETADDGEECGFTQEHFHNVKARRNRAL